MRFLSNHTDLLPGWRARVRLILFGRFFSSPQPHHFCLVATEVGGARSEPSNLRSRGHSPFEVGRVYWLFPDRLRVYHLLLFIGFSGTILAPAIVDGGGQAPADGALGELSATVAILLLLLLVILPAIVFRWWAPPVLTRHLSDLPPEYRHLWEPGIARFTMSKRSRFRSGLRYVFELLGVDYILLTFLFAADRVSAATFAVVRELVFAALWAREAALVFRLSVIALLPWNQRSVRDLARHRLKTRLTVWRARLERARSWISGRSPSDRTEDVLAVDGSSDEFREWRRKVELARLRFLGWLRPRRLGASLENWTKASTGRSRVLISIAIQELIFRNPDHPIRSRSLAAARWFLFTQTPLWLGWIALLFLFFFTTIGKVSLIVASIWWVVVSILFLHPERPMIERSVDLFSLSKLPNPKPIGSLFFNREARDHPVFDAFGRQAEYLLLTVFFVAAIALAQVKDDAPANVPAIVIDSTYWVAMKVSLLTADIAAAISAGIPKPPPFFYWLLVVGGAISFALLRFDATVRVVGEALRSRRAASSCAWKIYRSRNGICVVALLATIFLLAYLAVT